MHYSAADIVLKNKENMITDIILWIKDTHPLRTDSIFAANKCKRDLGTVTNAFINGLKFNNKENIQFLVEEFYRNNTLQLQSTNVEVASYTMLKDKIIDLCGTETIQAINHIKYLYNELITQLVNGPVYTEMNVEKASFIAERCQRNWDYNNPVSIADVNSIVQSAVSMPSKQNRQYYKLIVSTNTDFNRLCYTLAIDRTNPKFGFGKDINYAYHRNGQVLAPMLMLYTPADESGIDDPFNDDFNKNFYTSIGISSGVAAHSAAMLGYKTGFCACSVWGELYTALNEQYNIPIPEWNSGLMLGIGNPMWEYSRQAVLIDDFVYDTDDSYDKIVDINFVH
jgi:hypothetical protein